MSDLQGATFWRSHEAILVDGGSAHHRHAALAFGSAHAVVPYRVTDLGPGSAQASTTKARSWGSIVRPGAGLVTSSSRPGSGAMFLPQGFQAAGPSALNDAGLVAGAFHLPGDLGNPMPRCSTRAAA